VYQQNKVNQVRENPTEPALAVLQNNKNSKPTSNLLVNDQNESKNDSAYVRENSSGVEKNVTEYLPEVEHRLNRKSNRNLLESEDEPEPYDKNLPERIVLVDDNTEPKQENYLSNESDELRKIEENDDCISDELDKDPRRSYSDNSDVNKDESDNEILDPAKGTDIRELSVARISQLQHSRVCYACSTVNNPSCWQPDRRTTVKYCRQGHDVCVTKTFEGPKCKFSNLHYDLIYIITTFVLCF
jgi:hypothetical protein